MQRHKGWLLQLDEPGSRKISNIRGKENKREAFGTREQVRETGCFQIDSVIRETRGSPNMTCIANEIKSAGRAGFTREGAISHSSVWKGRRTKQKKNKKKKMN